MIDKTYVKDLERLVAKQEKAIQNLEKETMAREASAAVFAEYFIEENNTIPGGLGSDMRAILRVFKYYPIDTEHTNNYVCEIDIGEYKLLEKTVKRMFNVNLKDLYSLGLHIDVKS
jgi:hypothetical protein